MRPFGGSALHGVFRREQGIHFSHQFCGKCIRAGYDDFLRKFECSLATGPAQKLWNNLRFRIRAGLIASGHGDFVVAAHHGGSILTEYEADSHRGISQWLTYIAFVINDLFVICTQQAYLRALDSRDSKLFGTGGGGFHLQIVCNLLQIGCQQTAGRYQGKRKNCTQFHSMLS